MARTVAIGEQDFGKLIEKNCFYVDKTNFIKEWWESEDTVTLIARPRRFGKTLAMHMLRDFFSIRDAGRGRLFENLAVWQDERYQRLQGTYPVIFLSFAAVKEHRYDTARKKICQMIVNLYSDFYFLLQEGFLDEKEEAFFRRISADMDDVDATEALSQLSRYLYKYYGRKTVILLDEYDAPMQEAYMNGYWDEMARFIRSLFHASFKSNPFLERAVLTGVTRVSKESVFSDLNNLKVITATSRKYETAFGFTEDEVFQALEEFGLQDTRDEVKKWYDGFRFGNSDNIYNPWSVISYLDEKELRPFWMNTSSNTLAADLIRKGNTDIKICMEDLMHGKDICTSMDEQFVFSQLGRRPDAVWSLLAACGCLKVTGCCRRDGREEYTLAIVNFEVQEMFGQMFLDWFSDESCQYSDFKEALLSGDIQRMNAYLNEILFYTLSCYDTGKKFSKSRIHENFYHGFVLGLIAGLRSRYVISSNRESGFGRYDVMLLPLNPADDGMILEFKVMDADKEQSLQDTVDAALRQIIEKKYFAELEAKGIRRENIRIYGFAFTGKEVLAGGGPAPAYEQEYKG